jgi:hypothetical protein
MGKGEKGQMNVVYSSLNDTGNVYRKQQRQFDIINLYSRPSEPLRKFPKLSQEDRLLEKGMGY